MTKFRTHNCSELTEKDVGKNIKLSGWLHRKRDHGNLLFIDLRDHFGITQCVIENKDKNFKILEKLKPESVVLIQGNVAKRSSDTQNRELKTGMIEVKIKEFEILSSAKELPMPVFGEQDYPEGGFWEQDALCSQDSLKQDAKPAALEPRNNRTPACLAQWASSIPFASWLAS